ncbi:hypothetical protein FHS27_002869 [Rhodopirellula rubra]|uniref:Uncharacterized protein n=1 Tax=Aporhodopirellula rubra TaxID=980271 RepID=A0A7W5DZ11_9BACT|nr:hypothetical protein [Aporhodopirellula rubra]MBB3207050.1 hypothetical protein [Aporhodopirellula rubra]
MANPYTPPEIAADSPSTDSSSNIALFSPGQIAWATFLGAPIAGCLLLASNYRRLGKPADAQIAWVVGLLSTVLLLAIAFVLPDEFPNTVLPAAYTFTMYQCAKMFQGKEHIRQILSGIKGRSTWLVTGIGFLCLVLIYAAISAVVLVTTPE